ncbi:MAG: InlB B-repeat-containing protein, partial [Eubacteriales bacterium]|nr:InlB B-repeat-containing protein [Eubacteriales bacterium]
MLKWSQMKRFLSLTLCVLMVLSLLPTSTLAEDTPAPEETSAPVEATQPASEQTPASDLTETPSDAAEATPTPALSDAAEETPVASETTAVSETPVPSETPLEDVIPEGPQTYIVNFVIDHQTVWSMQQTVAEGDTVAAPAIPAVPDGDEFVGQVFLYWYVKPGQAYDFSTPVTSDLVLNAQFGELEDAPATEEEPIVADEKVLFSAFSMPGSIIPETVPLWNYTFVVDGTTVATKVVATGDTLDAPAMPSAPEGQKFAGWYTPDDDLFDSFGTQSVTEDGSTTLIAKFAPAYYVFFYNQFGAVTEI